MDVEEAAHHRALDREIDVLGDVASPLRRSESIELSHHNADYVPRFVEQRPAAIPGLDWRGYLEQARILRVSFS